MVVVDCSRFVLWLRSKLVTGTLSTAARIRSILSVKKMRFFHKVTPHHLADLVVVVTERPKVYSLC